MNKKQLLHILLLLLFSQTVLGKSTGTAFLIGGGCEEHKVTNMFKNDFLNLKKGLKKNKWKVKSFYQGKLNWRQRQGNKPPTMEAITSSLESEIENLNEGDQLMINIDTHGVMSENPTTGKLEHKFCIQDPNNKNKSIKVDSKDFLRKLKPHLKKLQDKGVKLALNSDACYGGQLIKDLQEVMSDSASNICSMAGTNGGNINYTDSSIIKTMSCMLNPRIIKTENSCKGMKVKSMSFEPKRNPSRAKYMDDVFQTHLLQNNFLSYSNPLMLPSFSAKEQNIGHASEATLNLYDLKGSNYNKDTVNNCTLLSLTDLVNKITRKIGRNRYRFRRGGKELISHHLNALIKVTTDNDLKNLYEELKDKSKGYMNNATKLNRRLSLERLLSTIRNMCSKSSLRCRENQLNVIEWQSDQPDLMYVKKCRTIIEESYNSKFKDYRGDNNTCNYLNNQLLKVRSFANDLQNTIDSLPPQIGEDVHPAITRANIYLSPNALLKDIPKKLNQSFEKLEEAKSKHREIKEKVNKLSKCMQEYFYKTYPLIDETLSLASRINASNTPPPLPNYCPNNATRGSVLEELDKLVPPFPNIEENLLQNAHRELVDAKREHNKVLNKARAATYLLNVRDASQNPCSQFRLTR